MKRLHQGGCCNQTAHLMGQDRTARLGSCAPTAQSVALC